MTEDSSAWTEWADVLTSAVGGGVIAILVWIALSEPCEIGTTGFYLDCVRVGAVEYSMGEIGFGVPVIATAIGFFVHFVRGTG